MKKNHFLIFMLAICSIFIISSCQKPGPEPDPIEVAVGAYVLNNGNYGSNDACLTFYDYSTKGVSANVFYNANGKKLGDTAQDMLVFGSKIYISVYNSKIIFVTDHKGKIIKEITVEGDNGNLSPRYLTSYGDKVYATYYEGYLGEIDTTSYAVRKVAVGMNPDGVVGASGKLYVANSGGLNYAGGYNNTVSVVSASTFTVTKTLEVVTNPQYLKVNSEGTIYLISSGNYADIPCTLQKIDSSTDAVTTIEGISPSFMAMNQFTDKMYLICSSYDADWNLTCSYYLFDTLTGKWFDFITDGTKVENAYSISVDPVAKLVYIGTSTYTENGDMYVFNIDGTLNNKFDTQGLNPIGVYPVTEFVKE